MKISDYLRIEACKMELEALTKEDAIREIVLNLSKVSKVNDPEKFIQDILERESLGSTGIGYGVAIPHSRTTAVEDFVIGFGRSTKGIDFKAIDGEPVNLIFLMGANPKELNLYLRLLAELSKLLMANSFRKELYLASSSQDIIEIFKKYETK